MSELLQIWKILQVGNIGSNLGLFLVESLGVFYVEELLGMPRPLVYQRVISLGIFLDPVIILIQETGQAFSELGDT